MAEFGVVCLLREPPGAVRAFIRHYLELGASELLLFFDDPLDPAVQIAEQFDSVRVRRCDVEFWSLRSGGRPEFVEGRQRFCYRRATQVLKSEWLLFVDCDEFLTSKAPIHSILQGLPSEAQALLASVAESVFPQMTEIDGFASTRLYRPIAPNQKLVQSAYGRNAALLRRGMAGHSVGKSFRRRDPELTQGLHFPAKELPEGAIVRAEDDLLLLHHDAPSFSGWRAKWMARVNGEVRMRGMGPQRLRQLDAFANALADGEPAIRELFSDLYVFDAKRRKKLLKHRLLIEIDGPFSPLTDS